MINKNLCFLSTFTILSPASALIKLPLTDNQASEVAISNKEFTRIAVRDDRIKQLFGATNEVSIETDDELGQVFVKPHTGSKKAVRLSLVTENGLTHDLKLIPQVQEPESILFMPGASKGKGEEPGGNDSNDSQETLLKFLSTLRKSWQFPDPGILPLKATHPGLEVRPLAYLKSEAFEGISYLLTNTSDAVVTLSDQSFYQLGTKAIALTTQTLEPQATTYLYIILENGHEDRKPLS